MLMKANPDILITGGQRADGLRFTFVDVTESAVELARSHLSGPAAATALGEGLVAVAILGGELTEPDEAFSLYMRTDGPIGSLLVDATFEGGLRGFTGKKILPDFDETENPDMAAVYGSEGEVSLVRSVPGRILSQSSAKLLAPSPLHAVSDYFAISCQRQTRVAFSVVRGLDGPVIARGLLVEHIPPASDPAIGQRVFLQLAEAMESPTFNETLEASPDPLSLFAEFGIEGVDVDPPRPLRFACNCSKEKAKATLLTFGKDELAAMASSGRNTDIYCHMCGRLHSFTPAEILSLTTGK